MTTPPTYGMYTVTANVNDIGVIQVPLITKDGRFEIDEKAVCIDHANRVDLDR